MKTVSDDLFRLIKALNKPEKGYFKKFAAKNATGSKQNYILLFDAIDSMDDYDEDLLRKKLKSESFIKQLAVYKVYLFNLILKSLHQYGAYDNSESKLTEYLINVKTLVSKNLYREALKILKKAKAMAYKFDKIKFLLEIISTERHIIMQMPQKNALELRREIYREQMKLYEKIGNFYQYSWLCDQMTILVDNEASHHSKETADRIEEIISHEYLKDEERPIGYYAKMNFYHTHLVYNGSRSDTQQIFHYLRKAIENAEANKQFIDENPQNYVIDLINYLLYCSYVKNKKEEQETLEKISTLRQRLKLVIPKETDIQIFYHASNVEMIINERNGDMKKGRIKAKQVEKELLNYKNDIPINLKAVLINNLACFYFIDGNYEASLKNINVILNDSSLNLRNDVYEFARLFQLMIHLELGNYDLLEYLIQSAVKYFKSKNKKGYKLEDILLPFFTKILKSRHEERKEIYEELLYRLNKIEKDSNGIISRGFFDYIAWVESKLNGKPLFEIIKEKNQ